MTAGEFEHKNTPRWRECEDLITELEKGRVPENAGQMPKFFRALCVDLSLARARMYGGDLTDRLNALVIRGYEQLYRRKRMGLGAVMDFVKTGFPRALRAEWRLFWLCWALFLIPFTAMLLSSKHDIQWLQSILGPDGMVSMEEMYGSRDGQTAHLREEFGSNFMMFCFYIKNNIGIDFQIFAGGVLAGVGTVFFLIFNGIYLGAAAGYVNHACDPVAFWSFVSGHSPYEITGMIVAGMAGMRLGLGILRPGRLTRVKALTEAGRNAMPLVYGAALLTFVAAIFEGFWSAQPVPVTLKYIVGILGWIGVFYYLVFCGREKRGV